MGTSLDFTSCSDGLEPVLELDDGWPESEDEHSQSDASESFMETT